MPWINEAMCTGCLICVGECPADAISATDGAARIDDDTCIRCGVCHDICPNDAVRHDGERVPAEVEANLAWVRTVLGHDYYGDDEQKRAALMERMERYFSKQIKVAKQTIERLSEVTAA